MGANRLVMAYIQNLMIVLVISYLIQEILWKFFELICLLIIIASLLPTSHPPTVPDNSVSVL